MNNGRTRTDDLAEAARTIYGEAWIEALAADMAISPAIVMRWQRGELEVPARVLAELGDRTHGGAIRRPIAQIRRMVRAGTLPVAPLALPLEGDWAGHPAGTAVADLLTALGIRVA